jgi:hypothetical protein
LFQYAMGRALATRRGTSLKFDTSKFEEYPLRSFALDHFAIEATPVTPAERRKLGLPDEPATRMRRLARRLFSSSTMPVIRERGFGFDPAALEAPAHCYLQGYWQSPKYFAAVEDTIRREFGFRDALSEKSSDVAKQIAQSFAVSVHVRRGDYAWNPQTRQYHGTCSPQYYAAAEARLRERLGDPTLFVFSDDPDWAEHNLDFRSRTVIVRHNSAARDYEDLHLMTLCRHHIIANSTFGWWGAWLCRHGAKVVIAPRNWFREAIAAEDLIPADWIRL